MIFLKGDLKIEKSMTKFFITFENLQLNYKKSQN